MMKKINLILALLIVATSQQLMAQAWSRLTSNYNEALLDVYFVNPQLGYASGYDGTILKTVNGGAEWTALNTGITDALAVIRFVDENTGYASGGFAGGSEMNCRLIKTTDGGSTWANIPVAPSQCGGGSWFLSADTGFYAYADDLYGESRIAKTTDGGSTWNVVYSSSGWISFFYFTDALNGYATVNNGTVLKTTDGGESWTETSLGQNAWGSGIYFFTKDSGIVGGKTNTNTAMFRTIDAGTSWSPVLSDNMIFKLFFADNANGYALSVDETGAGKMIKSTDGGASWSDEPTPEDNLRGLCFLETNLGYAVGDNGVILKYAMPASANDDYVSAKYGTVLFPNPFSTYATIQVNENRIKESMLLKVTNILGRECKVNSHIAGNGILIERGNLVPGCYFYQLLEGSVTIGRGQFAVK
jgi:photosystem II stability/assembly factor-like uncharacterized protein